MKIFFLFLALFYSSFLHACATCMLMSPLAEVSLVVHENEQKIKKIDLKWSFSDTYTQGLYIQYDKDRNNKLDKNELQEILQAKLDYLQPRNFLMKTTLIHNDVEETIPLRFENAKIELKDSMLYVYFEALGNYPIVHEDILSIVCEDEEGFFSFVITDFKLASSSFKTIDNLYLHVATIMLSSIENTSPQKKDKDITDKEPKQTTTPNQDQKKEKTLLEKSVTKLKALLQEIKEGKSTLSYLLLLLFAYAYGVIHAMGPGHGKTLVSSYFLSHDKSYSKALWVSSMIGIVHTFSAFILTLLLYYVISSFLAGVLDDAVYYTTKISALIIIMIAAYLFIKKLRNSNNTNKFTFSTQPHESSCGCNACKIDDKADFALILSAGIIPCPGTVTLFIFAFSLELYTVGILSALLMSLGMSTIIFLSAIISVTIRKKGLTERPRLKRALEYMSLGIIFILGIALLLF